MAGQCHGHDRQHPRRGARLGDGGRIIFIGSLLGSYVPFPGVADYAGTKWALVGYAKGIARELGPRNITVNVVQPGIMPTDMAAQVQGELPNRDAILDLHPIRRIATLEEVGDTICFLAGPSAGYITGETINIAGGAWNLRKSIFGDSALNLLSALSPF